MASSAIWKNPGTTFHQILWKVHKSEGSVFETPTCVCDSKSHNKPCYY